MTIATLVEMREISFSYGPGPKLLLQSLYFNLKSSETVYLRGESGCGKSSFLKLLNRLLDPSAGEILFCGKPYAEHDVIALRKKVQLVSQIPFLFPMDVEGNLKLAAPHAANEEILSLLDTFNLPPGILAKPGNDLSVGQAQRVCVIRSLLLNPAVLLLDEPTAALDPENRKTFSRGIERMREAAGFSAVWVTHGGDYPGQAPGRRLLMKDGMLHGD